RVVRNLVRREQRRATAAEIERLEPRETLLAREHRIRRVDHDDARQAPHRHDHADDGADVAVNQYEGTAEAHQNVYDQLARKVRGNPRVTYVYGDEQSYGPSVGTSRQPRDGRPYSLSNMFCKLNTMRCWRCAPKKYRPDRSATK